MPLQGEYEPSTAEWVNKQVTEYEGSGGTAGTLLRGVPTVVVTMIGASTGNLRKHPVMRVEHEGTYAAVASKGGAPKNPTWVANLRKNPLVEVQDGPAHGDYRAREASADEYATWWQRAIEVWPDYVSYQAKTERQIPIFLLEPVS
jgi:F420H(2)-dependent quinone reductase